jgi:hypothetical protein
MGQNNKADIEYSFEHGEVINYIKIQASFLTQLPERKETAQGTQQEAKGDFKAVTAFNGCDRRKRRMDQQHCSYSTLLT